MSFKIDKVSHTLKTVLQASNAATVKTTAKNKTATAVPQTIYIPQGLILPAHAAQSLQSQPEQNQINYEEIEFLVETLQEIAGDRQKIPFGFRPEKVDKVEEILVKTAIKHVNNLMDKPTKINLQTARKFIKTMNVIGALEGIASDRNSVSFGFKKNEDIKDDLKLAQEALDIAKSLKILAIKGTATKSSLKDAVEFVGLMEVIDTLELLAQENSKGKFGLIQDPEDKNEKGISEIALELAKRLKVKSDPDILQAAVEFIELASQFTELNKAKKEVTKQTDNCYGLHCSFDEYESEQYDESEEYALAA